MEEKEVNKIHWTYLIKRWHRTKRTLTANEGEQQCTELLVKHHSSVSYGSDIK